MSAPAPRRLNALQFSLVAACVLAAVLPHLWRLPFAFACAALLVLAVRWVTRLRGAGRVPGWIKLPLILAFPAYVVLHYGNVFGREPGSALACAMLVLKLVESEAPRDARAVVCFGSFVLMSALLFNNTLGFTLLLCGAIVLYFATLRELEPRPAAHAAPWTGRLLRDVRLGAFALLGAIPLALCGFAFFPRLGTPLWGAPNDSMARTGLGDSMTPGAIQELLTDDSPAFRVTFFGKVPPRTQLYWRGPVLWSFDGATWTRPDYFRLSEKPDVSAQGGRILYEVMLEPTDRRWLLALDAPLDVPPGATRALDLTLVAPSQLDHLQVYRLTSATRYVLDAELDPERRKFALRLPPNLNPRARELAQRWRTELGSDEKIIAAALALFHQSFYYTLAPPELGRDSIDDFLFQTRQGFCEHYSSAFTYLMRAAGIPARVVTGYQGGYYNDSSNYLLVRQSDAHAWSEVWLEGRGWVRVDPTAAVSPLRVQLGARAAAGESAPWYQAEWLQLIRNEFDLVNRVWNDAIVQFNALRQQSMLTPFGIEHAEYADLMAVLIASSTLLLGVFAWWTLRARRAALEPLDLAYQRLCRKLARAGAARAAHEGPLAYAARTAAAGVNPAGLLGDLLADYATLRYGHAEPPPERVAAFARRVASLRVHAPASASG